MNGLRVGLASVALLIAAGCGGESGSNEPKTFDASGTFTLKQVEFGAAAGDTCAGTKGYDDITGGAQVVVRDAGGKNVGLGELGEGKRYASPGWCEFSLSVTDIPASIGIFSIEVSHRGEISFKHANAGSLALTLG